MTALYCPLCHRGVLNTRYECVTCGAETCPSCNRFVINGESCECGADALYCEACGRRVASGPTCPHCGCNPAAGRIPDGTEVRHGCGWVGDINAWRAGELIACVAGETPIYRACVGCGSHASESSFSIVKEG